MTGAELRWFGPSWHAPINETAEHVETPVGFCCAACGHAIAEGDRGLFVWHAGFQHAPDGHRPEHLRCFLAQLGIIDYRHEVEVE